MVPPGALQRGLLHRLQWTSASAWLSHGLGGNTCSSLAFFTDTLVPQQPPPSSFLSLVFTVVFSHAFCLTPDTEVQHILHFLKYAPVEVPPGLSCPLQWICLCLVRASPPSPSTETVTLLP